MKKPALHSEYLLSLALTIVLTLTLTLTGTLASGLFHTTTAQERSNDAPRVSPNASVSQTIGTTIVTITYGRPSVKDREIYGGLVPFDAVWRAGANESTVVTVSDDVMIGENTLAAGSYSLFAIPGESSWSILFNADASQWGSYSYNADDNVLSFDTTSEEATFMEQLTYYFENVTENSATLWLHWADVRVPVAIQAMPGETGDE